MQEKIEEIVSIVSGKSCGGIAIVNSDCHYLAPRGEIGCWECQAQQIVDLDKPVVSQLNEETLYLSDVEELSHFGVVRDWTIKLKSGRTIVIGADIIKEITRHNQTELPVPTEGLLSDEMLDFAFETGEHENPLVDVAKAQVQHLISLGWKSPEEAITLKWRILEVCAERNQLRISQQAIKESVYREIGGWGTELCTDKHSDGFHRVHRDCPVCWGNLKAGKPPDGKE